MRFKHISLDDFKKGRMAYRLDKELAFQLTSKSQIDQFNDAKAELLAEMETEMEIVKNMTLAEFKAYKKINFRLK